MKSVLRAALMAPFFFLATACNNDADLDPVVGSYELTLFDNLLMPVSEVQTQVSNGVFCDIERNGIVSFANNLDFSLSATERLFNCSDITFNSDDSVVILGFTTVGEIGSSYTATVSVDGLDIALDCNLQGDNLFCQGARNNTVVEFQAQRTE